MENRIQDSLHVEVESRSHHIWIGLHQRAEEPGFLFSRRRHGHDAGKEEKARFSRKLLHVAVRDLDRIAGLRRHGFNP